MKTNNLPKLTPGKVMMASAIVLAALPLVVSASVLGGPPIVGFAMAGLFGFLGAAMEFVFEVGIE